MDLGSIIELEDSAVLGESGSSYSQVCLIRLIHQQLAGRQPTCFCGACRMVREISMIWVTLWTNFWCDGGERENDDALVLI